MKLSNDPTDLFEEKIMYSHLVDYFPEYDGKSHYLSTGLNCLEVNLFFFINLSTKDWLLSFPYITARKDHNVIRCSYVAY